MTIVHLAITTCLIWKMIHGAHLDQLQRPETDIKATHKWLVQGRLRAETEAVVVAAQCGILKTNTYKQ